MAQSFRTCGDIACRHAALNSQTLPKKFIRKVNKNKHDNCSKDILSMKAETWNTWNNSGVDLITFFSNHCDGPRFSTLLLFCWRISITTAWVAVLFARLPRIDSMEKEERGWEKDGIWWNTLSFFPATFFFLFFDLWKSLLGWTCDWTKWS